MGNSFIMCVTMNSTIRSRTAHTRGLEGMFLSAAFFRCLMGILWRFTRKFMLSSWRKAFAY
uniref:Uncharacterized protein n=1 Tax=Anguilla anguilla TaxID=7936 RepID=A0A0E9R605_ANGAN